MRCVQLEELQAEAEEEERVRLAEARAAAARIEHEAAARAAAAKTAKAKAIPVKKALLVADAATVSAPDPAVPAAVKALTVTPPEDAPCLLSGAALCVLQAAEDGFAHDLAGNMALSWSVTRAVCTYISCIMPQVHRTCRCRRPALAPALPTHRATAVKSLTAAIRDRCEHVQTVQGTAHESALIAELKEAV